VSEDPEPSLSKVDVILTFSLEVGKQYNTVLTPSQNFIRQIIKLFGMLGGYTGRSPGQAEGLPGCGHSKMTRVRILSWPLPLLSSL